MQKITKLFLMATVALSTSLQAADSFGYKSNEVPEDWTNDLWLTSHFKPLTVGDSCTIGARRVPEIVENAVSSVTAQPTYTYEIVSGSSATVNAGGVVTATALGTTIIEVGYKETVAFEKTFAAISPINKSYVIVEVKEDLTPALTLTSTLKDEEFLNTYNTFYYTGYRYNYPVTFGAEGADASFVVCNGDTLKSESGNYMLKLQNRANIVELAATKGEQVEREFYVIDARKVEINVENQTNAGAPITAGDVAHISFKGITPALYKLAKIYNPQMAMGAWGGNFCTVKYNAVYAADTTAVKSNYEVTQYNLHSNNTIEMTFDKAGEYTFVDGMMDTWWWGSALGTEKANDLPSGPNLGAPTGSAELGAMPSFAIQVQSGDAPANQEILDVNQPTNPATLSFEANGTWSESYNETDYPTIDFGNFTFKHHAMAAYYSWDGFTISNSQDNELGHSEGFARQWGNMAQGGVAGKGTPFLLGYYSYYESYGKDASNASIYTKNNKEYELQGLYVNTTAYTHNTIEIGDAFARAFAANDSLVLIAQAIGADGKADPTREVRKVLADYRGEKTNNWRLNQAWEWMDLSALGKVYGVSFTMTSTDSGSFGANTPTYFALDGLRGVATGVTGVENNTVAATQVTYAAQQLVVRAAEAATLVVMNLQGEVVLQAAIEAGEQSIAADGLAQGIYIVRVGDTTTKVVVR